MESQSTPRSLAGKQMSASLRERLKRSGRSYMSPVLPKKPRHDQLASPLLRPARSLDSMAARLDDHDSPQETADTNCPICAELNPKTSAEIQHTPTIQMGTKKSNRAARPNLNVQSSDKRHMHEISNTESSLRNKSPDNLRTANITSGRTDESSSSSGDVENRGTQICHSAERSDTSSAEQQMAHTSNGVLHLCGNGENNSDSASKLREKSERSIVELRQEKQHRQEQVAKKEEQLRKLNMVQMYRAKNDLSTLQGLIDKWRGSIPDLVQQLWEHLDEPRPSLTRLVEHLQLDPTFIGFNPEDETFQ